MNLNVGSSPVYTGIVKKWAIEYDKPSAEKFAKLVKYKLGDNSAPSQDKPVIKRLESFIGVEVPKTMTVGILVDLSKAGLEGEGEAQIAFYLGSKENRVAGKFDTEHADFCPVVYLAEGASVTWRVVPRYSLI